MTAVDLVRRLHQHRTWVNHKLLSVASNLTNEQMHQPFAIGQGSLWKSLVHLYAAEYVWLGALQGDDDPVAPGDVRGKIPGNQLADDRLLNLVELRTRWEQLDQRWIEYLDQLTDAKLDELTYKQSTSSGIHQRWGTKTADVLLHLCTHAQYTTAQIVNVLRQLGVTSLPDVMLISLARQEAKPT